MWAEAQWGQRDSYSLGVTTRKYWLPACLQQLGSLRDRSFPWGKHDVFLPPQPGHPLLRHQDVCFMVFQAPLRMYKDSVLAFVSATPVPLRSEGPRPTV